MDIIHSLIYMLEQLTRPSQDSLAYQSTRIDEIVLDMDALKSPRILTGFIEKRFATESTSIYIFKVEWKSLLVERYFEQSLSRDLLNTQVRVADLFRASCCCGILWMECWFNVLLSVLLKIHRGKKKSFPWKTWCIYRMYWVEDINHHYMNALHASARFFLFSREVKTKFFPFSSTSISRVKHLNRGTR